MTSTPWGAIDRHDVGEHLVRAYCFPERFVGTWSEFPNVATTRSHAREILVRWHPDLASALDIELLKDDDGG